MKKKDWPNFSKTLISKVGKIIKSGQINYTSNVYGRKFENDFSNFTGNKY